MTSREEYLEKAYGKEQQERLLSRYRQRKSNHWALRLKLGEDLFKEYSNWCKENRVEEPSIVLDVGCAIGTFAIEFAKKGYTAFGVDISPEAIVIADQLAEDEGVPQARFFCGDVRAWRPPKESEVQSVDATIAMDLIEHLHDRELEEMLLSFKKFLKINGAVLFHTFPTRYEPIFFNRAKPYLSAILSPFKKLPERFFSIFLEGWFHIFNLLYFVKHGQTYLDEIKGHGHCNPTTRRRLERIFERCGYKVIVIETGNLYRGMSSTWEPFYRKFDKQPDAHRHIWGVVVRES
jgi:cyclopropane fatty-acyl-phospholipid synthase-like methyltransferase